MTIKGYCIPIHTLCPLCTSPTAFFGFSRRTLTVCHVPRMHAEEGDMPSSVKYAVFQPTDSTS